MELVLASMQQRGFLYRARGADEDSLGLSAHEFVDFVMVLSVYRWRAIQSLKELGMEEAVARTLKRVSEHAMRHKAVGGTGNVGEIQGGPQTSKSLEEQRKRREEVVKAVEKEDLEFLEKKEVGMSLFERLKLQHKFKLKDSKQ